MFRLTREIRFAVNHHDRPQADITNGHAGYPAVTGFGAYYHLRITLAGDLRADTGYLRNIKDIDHEVRQHSIPWVADASRNGGAFFTLPAQLFEQLRFAWPGATLEKVDFRPSPFLSLMCLAEEYPMIRLSQKFEFCASHRLHNAALSDDENRAAFGKCNNPLGHGHNYEIQVTLKGSPGNTGRLIDAVDFERTVNEAVIDRFDHKFLNAEVDEFRDLNPSVENISRVIYALLQPRFIEPAQLASVTVWETPKTWCEYSE